MLLVMLLPAAGPRVVTDNENGVNASVKGRSMACATKAETAKGVDLMFLVSVFGLIVVVGKIFNNF